MDRLLPVVHHLLLVMSHVLLVMDRLLLVVNHLLLVINHLLPVVNHLSLVMNHLLLVIHHPLPVISRLSGKRLRGPCAVWALPAPVFPHAVQGLPRTEQRGGCGRYRQASGYPSSGLTPEGEIVKG
jgi:hypothetical protein